MKDYLLKFGIAIFVSIFLLGCKDSTILERFEAGIKNSQEKTSINRKHKNFDNSDINIGDSIVGKVIKIHDGDTYDALVEDKGKKTTIRIRMQGIDAPERGMPFSKKATEYLRGLCAEETVGILVGDIDQYDRIVAYTYLKDGRELCHEMVKAGFAWYYYFYSDDETLQLLEEKARKEKRGLWADTNPIPPRESRRQKRK